VLILAAEGGTVSNGGARLTFAPDALSGDAYVLVAVDHRAVPGLSSLSPVYDLLAYDAHTGEPIETFLVDPVLTIAVGSTTPPDGVIVSFTASSGTLDTRNAPPTRRARAPSPPAAAASGGLRSAPR
jgi:hypothetical protein